MNNHAPFDTSVESVFLIKRKIMSSLCTEQYDYFIDIGFMSIINYGYL